MTEMLLPVGSVVKLKNLEHPVLVFGVYQVENTKNQTYDYLGCLYPEGFLGQDGNMLFNASAIEEVLFEGYKTPEYERLVMAVAKRKAAKEDKIEE